MICNEFEYPDASARANALPIEADIPSNTSSQEVENADGDRRRGNVVASYSFLNARCYMSRTQPIAQP